MASHPPQAWLRRSTPRWSNLRPLLVAEFLQAYSPFSLSSARPHRREVTWVAKKGNASPSRTGAAEPAAESRRSFISIIEPVRLDFFRSRRPFHGAVLFLPFCQVALS